MPIRSVSPSGVCFAALGFMLLFLFIVSNAEAEDFHNSLSFQGYTGLLNTPNAETTGEGKLDALYTDQRERQWRDLASHEDNYLFSVGFFSFAELGGRLTDAPGAGVRDLSANFKVKAPFIPRGYYLPDIALGIQDAGGGARHLQTRYLVASEEWWRFRFSLGYGTGPDRMKGVFGGAEFKAFEWLYLLGENDTKETNFGARLVTRDLFGYPVNLELTAKTSLDYRTGTPEFGFGLQFPLGNEHHDSALLPENAGETSHPTQTEKSSAGPDRQGATPWTTRQQLPAPRGPTTPLSAAEPALSSLIHGLADEGFENVRVGTRGDELLVVEFENGRYDHNELDALGVVIGMVADFVPSGFETLRLVVEKQGIRILTLSAPIEDFRAFLRDPGKYGTLNEHLLITTDTADDDTVNFIDDVKNPSWLNSTLVIYPGLKTFVGTEVGAFDYLVSARPDYSLNVWKGAVVNARWDLPFFWSENFRDDKPFSSRGRSRLDRLMLFQAIKLSPTVMANLGGGMVLHDLYGSLNEVVWTPGDGTHRFLVRHAYAARSDDGADRQKHEVYLGSYRYFFSSLDLSLEGTAGRFFDNDEGFRIDVKRFFGDTAFSVYFINSRTTEQERVKVGGIMIALPLTFRRDMKPGILQVKGLDDWSYSQETRIVKGGELNLVSPSVGVEPVPLYNVERVFFNRDRLSGPYIRKHLLRLRDAYRIYREKWSSRGSASMRPL